ncbi:MAG: cytosine permease [Nocardioidaceae bacterium]|nr:cytosine permease [Nocardioidaceae bacterium]
MTADPRTSSERVGNAPVDPDYPVMPVPPHARKSLVSLLFVLCGFTVFTPTMLAGAALAPNFTAAGLVGVIAAGSLILGTYVAVMGWVGSRTRLTTVVMARYGFGTRGAKLASLLLGGTQIGWYGVTIGTIGDLTATATGWDSFAARASIMVLTSALMCATACYGFRGMALASMVSTPLIVVLAFWVLSRSLDEVGGWSGFAAIEPSGSLATSVAITTVVGTFISAGTQAPNWTRFARTGRQAVWACVAAFVLGNGLMVFFGAVGALTFQQADFVLVLYNLGLVGWGLVLLFGNLWTSNADTAYAFGVAGAELFERPTKTPFVIGGTIIGTVLALVGVQNHLITYLGLLGTFIPPLGGVIIGDFLARWRGGVPDRDVYTPPTVRWENLAVYAVAGLAAWGTGEIGWGIPPLTGVLLAVGLTLAVSRLQRVTTPA